MLSKSEGGIKFAAVAGVLKKTKTLKNLVAMSFIYLKVIFSLKFILSYSCMSKAGSQKIKIIPGMDIKKLMPKK